MKWALKQFSGVQFWLNSSLSQQDISFKFYHCRIFFICLNLDSRIWQSILYSIQIYCTKSFINLQLIVFKLENSFRVISNVMPVVSLIFQRVLTCNIHSLNIFVLLFFFSELLINQWSMPGQLFVLDPKVSWSNFELCFLFFVRNFLWNDAFELLSYYHTIQDSVPIQVVCSI